MRALPLTFALLFAVTAATAQPAQRGPTPPAPAAPSTTAPAPSVSSAVPPLPARAGAILHVAHEVMQGLGAIPPGTIVVASALTTDIVAPKGDDLAIRIAAQVAGRMGAKAHPQPVALAVARGVSGRAASLVYLQIEIAKGELRVTADLYPVVSNGWERLRNPVPGPRAHVFAMAPLDAEIRGFLVPVLLEQAQVHKIKQDEGEILALGCGDVDGDGGLELVVVTRARVSVGKIRGGKLVVQRAAAWSTIASRASVPLREPIASVLVSPRGHRGEIILGTSDRGGIVLDASLVARRQLTGLPVVGGEGEACVSLAPETSAFEGSVVPCELAPPPKAGERPVEPLPLFLPPASRYDAIASFDAVGRDGSVAHVVAVREPSGKLRVRRQELGVARAVETTLDNAGAQVAVVDLDLDGIPEIVTTLDSTTDDVVLVSSFVKGVLTPRLRFPTKESVRAVGVCPPEERGVPGLVAAVGNEVWLVR